MLKIKSIYDFATSLYHYFLLIKYKLTAMDRNTINSQSSSNNNHLDYKYLYEQSRKNVALFINHVDGELTKILHRHQNQINELKRQNQQLREQIKVQTQSFMSSKGWQISQIYKENHRSYSTNKCDIKYKMDDIANCGLSQIKMSETKSVLFDKKRGRGIDQILTDRQQNIEHQIKEIAKQSKRVCLQSKQRNENLNRQKTNDLNDLKQIIKNYQKGKKSTRKYNRDNKDRDSIQDILKNIREKANTSINTSLSSIDEKKQKIIQIISPQLFAFSHR